MFFEQNATPSTAHSSDSLTPAVEPVIENEDQNEQADVELADELAAVDDDHDIVDLMHASKPWYFAGGQRSPGEARRSKSRQGRRLAKLLPEEDRWSDRITNQLMFVPPGYAEYRESGKMKTILLYNGMGPWGKVNEGRDIFVKCPVNTCRLTVDRDRARNADLVLYKDHFIPTGLARPARQLFMLYFLECPYHTQHVKFPNVFNWTSTYRYV